MINQKKEADRRADLILKYLTNGLFVNHFDGGIYAIVGDTERTQD